MNGPRTTGPMAIIKTEGESTFPTQQRPTHSLNSGALIPAPASRPSSDITYSLLSNAVFSEPLEEELNLPPLMKQRLEVVKRTEPAKVQDRYNEFEALEEKLASTLVQEGDEIKL
jgi:hypothetical protein